MGEKIGLGKFISKRRRMLDMTQEELARRIGVSKSAVAKWETEGGLPDRDNLGKLAEALNISVDELHRRIRGSDMEDTSYGINITTDVIVALESYGYKVIRPGVKDSIGEEEE
jgi:transcriptional regulator with XRE-family HTH domain